MSSLVISGDTSGQVALTVPAVAGTNTITIPASSGTMLTTANSGRCAAWVNFNSNGSINGSYNVTSVSNIGTGVYQITFTTAFANTNYCPMISSAFASGIIESVFGVVYNDPPYAPTTSVLTIVFHRSPTDARINPTFGYVAVFS